MYLLYIAMCRTIISDTKWTEERELAQKSSHCSEDILFSTTASIFRDSFTLYIKKEIRFHKKGD